jgi:hypothetical protein
MIIEYKRNASVLERTNQTADPLFLKMNIQHFSSLAEILIDAHGSEASPLTPTERSPFPSPAEKYEEETFEHESHVMTYSHDGYGSGDEHYENTFEETGLSQLEGEQPKKRDDRESQQQHDEEQYENTFENEFSQSILVQNSTPCPSFEENQTSLSRAESKLYEALGSMSVIKPTENIKTFGELAMISTPSSSSSSDSSSTSQRHRMQQFDSQSPLVKPSIGGLSSSRPSARERPLLPSSSESSTRKYSNALHSHPSVRTDSEGVKHSTPKLFSKVKLMTREELQHLRPPQPVSPSEGKRNSVKETVVPTSKNSYNKIDPWDLTTDDLLTMRKTKEILERIEAQQKSLQDQQIHRMVLLLLYPISSLC